MQGMLVSGGYPVLYNPGSTRTRRDSKEGDTNDDKFHAPPAVDYTPMGLVEIHLLQIVVLLMYGVSH
jgi:hypothetical protein